MPAAGRTRRWPEIAMKRRRLYVVKGRLRIPFEGYTAPLGLADHGLTRTQARRVAERVAELNGKCPLTGSRRAARIAGVVSSVKSGRVGNSAWGWHARHK